MNIIDTVNKTFEEGYGPDRQLMLDLHGVKVSVATDSAGIAEMLGAYYADYLVRGDAASESAAYHVDAFQKWIPVDEARMTVYVEKGKKKPKEAYADDESGRRLVLKVRSGVILLIDGNRYRVAGDLEQFGNQLNNIINAVFIIDRMSAGYTLFHSSALSLAERGIILTGRSGAGKSSAAIWLLDHGFSILTNDRLLVRRPAGGGEASIPMLGVPKKPRINPGTIVSNPRLHGLLSADELNSYRAMPMEELWHVERKFDLDVKAVYGEQAECRGSGLHSAYFLDWTVGGGECRCDPLPEDAFEDFCHAVFKDAGVFDPRNSETSMKADHVDEYKRVLKGIPIYRFTGGVSFESLMEEIPRLVAG